MALTARSDRSPPALYIRRVDPATYRDFTRLAFIHRATHGELLTALVSLVSSRSREDELGILLRTRRERRSGHGVKSK